jgi:hypothetical protein
MRIEHPDGIRGVDVQALWSDGERIVVGYDGEAAVFDLAGQELYRVATGPAEIVDVVVDGDFLAVSSEGDVTEVALFEMPATEASGYVAESSLVALLSGGRTLVRDEPTGTLVLGTLTDKKLLWRLDDGRWWLPHPSSSVRPRGSRPRTTRSTCSTSPPVPHASTVRRSTSPPSSPLRTWSVMLAWCSGASISTRCSPPGGSEQPGNERPAGADRRSDVDEESRVGDAGLEPTTSRPAALDEPLETSAQRLRDHLRRPTVPTHKLETADPVTPTRADPAPNSCQAASHVTRRCVYVGMGSITVAQLRRPCRAAGAREPACPDPMSRNGRWAMKSSSCDRRTNERHPVVP